MVVAKPEYKYYCLDPECDYKETCPRDEAGLPRLPRKHCPRCGSELLSRPVLLEELYPREQNKK